MRSFVVIFLWGATLWGQSMSWTPGVSADLLEPRIVPCTVAELSAPNPTKTGRLRVVTDAQAATSCSTGGGNKRIICVDTGTAWAPFDSAAGAAAWGGITGTLSDQTDLQSALDAKSSTSHNHAGTYEPAIASGNTGQYWRGDKSWQTVDKSVVGLANADNTSDANKPISTATQAALDGKAAATHGHAQSEVTNLVTDLAAKVPTSRTVNGHALGSDVTVTKSDVSLGNVEDIALSTWSGSSSLTTLGTVATGTWNATAIDWAKVNKTGSNLADMATRSHTALSDIGSNSHSAIDTFIASKAAASGLASLDASSLVVQNPANATATPAGSKIPIAGAGGTLAAGWLPLPTASTIGGVKSLTCSGTDKLSAIGTDGLPVCAADQGGAAAWGSISGTLSAQTDLQTALDGKSPVAGSTSITTLGTIATGTVPWARLSDVPSTFTPASHGSTAHDSTVAKTDTPGTTGTAPNWASSVLNIPMAATASVTAGLVSKTQYDTFNGKQDALGFTPVPNTRSVSTSSPLGGGGALSSDLTLTCTACALNSAPGTSGTAPNWASSVLNIPMASTASVTAGLLSKTDYDTFAAKPGLVSSGTAGIAAFNAGTAATASRSDHTHRAFASLSWFFPGVVVSGTQTARALVPEGVTNCTITNSRITVNTTSGSSSTYNIARCTTSAGNCTATNNLYSSAVTLNASTESVAGGAPNTATITAGDAFKVTLTPGSGLADVTVTMTYKCENIN